jgi:hypothetical protein
MQPVQTPHDREIGGRYRPRQVINAATADVQIINAATADVQIINAATADVQSFRLLADRQVVCTVDHRFALNSPALVSAPSKKLSRRCAPPVG